MSSLTIGGVDAWLSDMLVLERELEARLGNVRRMVANVRAGRPPWP